MATKTSSVSIPFKLPTDVMLRIYFLFKCIIYIWNMQSLQERCAPYPTKHCNCSMADPSWPVHSLGPYACSDLTLYLFPHQIPQSLERFLPFVYLWLLQSRSDFMLLSGDPSDSPPKQIMLEALWRIYDNNSSPTSIQSLFLTEYSWVWKLLLGRFFSFPPWIGLRRH